MSVDLYVEELPREAMEGLLDGLSLEVLSPSLALNSSLGTFTSFSTFTCPFTSLGTVSTVSTYG